MQGRRSAAWAGLGFVLVLQVDAFGFDAAALYSCHGSGPPPWDERLAGACAAPAWLASASEGGQLLGGGLAADAAGGGNRCLIGLPLFACDVVVGVNRPSV